MASGAGRKTAKGTGPGGYTETKMSTGMSTRVGIRARTGAGTWTRIEMRVEGRESLRTFKVVIEVDRKTRKGGRC